MDIDKLIDDLKKAVESGNGVDNITVKEASSVISRLGSFILGLLCIIIIIIFPIIVALEIIYICFPLFRDKVEQLCVWMDLKGADARIVAVAFRDAKEAIVRADTVATGKNPLYIYMGIKAKSIAFVFFIVAIVIEGGDFIIKAVYNLLGNFLSRIFF